MRDDGQPVLFVMNMQKGFVQPDLTQPPHLYETARLIQEFVLAAREAGCRVVWSFRHHAENAATSFVTDDFKKAKEALTLRGDGPLDELPVMQGDQFWVRPALVPLPDQTFADQLSAMKLTRATLLAGCGFYHEEPAKDGTYLWAQELEQGFSPVILQDLTDNPQPFAQDEKARKNVAFLQRLHGHIGWIDSADWLDIVADRKGGGSASSSSGHVLPFGAGERFDLVTWLDDMTKDCPLRPCFERGIERGAHKLMELVG